MKSGVISIVVGLVMFLAALWGGAWLYSIFPPRSTYGLPAFMSALILAISGIAFILFGGYKLEYPEP